MFSKDQKTVEDLLKDIEIPRMILAEQQFEEDYVQGIEEYLRNLLLKQDERRIKPGMRIAITAGSRGITDIAVIIREVVLYVKSKGAIPVIIPAMGSHGGSTSDGQKNILESYGITEEMCGCRIHSSMETVLTGKTLDGLPVFIDKYASESDGIIVIGRIKAHTAFKGKYESGLLKMLAVGLGKQKGADSIHEAGFGELAKRLPQYARIIVGSNNVLFGLGIIENAYDKTCRIEVIKTEELFTKEAEMLEYAKKRMAQLYIKECDVLVVSEIGKNYSGSGMDPNITGTWSTPYGFGGIKKQKTVVLGLSDKSHGNIIGLGKADFSTYDVMEKINLNETYANALTSTVIEPCKIPMMLKNDETAIKAAIKTCNGIDKRNIKIVYIKNTLDLEKIMISEAFTRDIKNIVGLRFLGEPFKLKFNNCGSLINGL